MAGYSVGSHHSTWELPVTRRSNDEWIAALSRPGPSQERALDDLRLQLARGLRYALGSRSGLDDAVMGYTLKYIGDRGVVLRNENHIKKLFLHKTGDNLIKLEER